MKNYLILVVLSICFSANVAHGELALTGVDVAATIDFAGFTGSGFTPTPAAGQLDSNTWSTSGFSSNNVGFGGTETTGDAARGTSTGGESTGGVYSFNTGSNGASLGVQPAGSDFTPGTFTLAIMNNTGSALDSFDIAYDVFVFNDQGRANSFNFSWSTDSGGSGTYTSVGSLDLTSPETADGTPAWVQNNRSTTISFGSALANGAIFYLRWTGDDETGGGSRDEFGLDNISVTGRVAAIPEPSTLAMFAVAMAGIGYRRRKQAQF